MNGVSQFKVLRKGVKKEWEKKDKNQGKKSKENLKKKTEKRKEKEKSILMGR